MKKLTQKGFSLAEILIALAIISVISTLGFSIAKKGIEDAYQGYFYTGYNGLYTALSIAKEDYYTNPPNSDKNLSSYVKAQHFVKHVKKILNLTETPGTDEATAPNGVKYTFKITSTENTETPPPLNITMEVPSVKTNIINSNSRKVELIYDGTRLTSNVYSYNSNKLKSGYVAIGNRKDLVAFECVKEIAQVVHDCKDDETECEILYDEGDKTYETINTFKPDDCETYKLVNPKYIDLAD